MQAAMLYCQLKKLPRIREQRRNTYELYCSAFEKNGIRTMKRVVGSDFIPFRMTAIVENVDLALENLEKIAVRGRRFFYPMSLQPSLEGLVSGKCENAKWLYDHGVCLPIHRGVDSSDIERISEALALV